ncbi:hypothetical protein ACODGR_12000, partial [Vagococcus fluvialis]|uniref:hypothetical protein n=1 Tax=Vagococcus fluvialis TaxID=2738 RepID=UPI003B20F4C1
YESSFLKFGFVTLILHGKLICFFFYKKIDADEFLHPHQKLYSRNKYFTYFTATFYFRALIKVIE